MKKRFYALLSIIFLGTSPLLFAQDDFNFDDFSAAENTEIKSFCNNKVLNLSPSRLLSFSYDFMGGYDYDYEAGDGLPADQQFAGTVNNKIGSNHGFRFESNYPIISKSNILVNAYANYWESRYSFDSGDQAISTQLEETGLRTTALGLIVFKPLDEKKFMVFQAEGAVNGNYNFSDIDPEIGEMKISATFLYGWKFDDSKNFAVGVTRTYRGGRALHIPIIMYNKTWSEKWGVEMLLPARAALRRNFGTKSLLQFGYELEGASYYLQPNEGPINDATTAELRKSEIRARVSWQKALSDFIWFNIDAGAMVNYRFDIDQNADSTDPALAGSQGIPFYFRFGISLVSP